MNDRMKHSNNRSSTPCGGADGNSGDLILGRVPHEIFCAILSFVSVNDRINVSLTCRGLNKRYCQCSNILIRRDWKAIFRWFHQTSYHRIQQREKLNNNDPENEDRRNQLDCQLVSKTVTFLKCPTEENLQDIRHLLDEGAADTKFKFFLVEPKNKDQRYDLISNVRKYICREEVTAEAMLRVLQLLQEFIASPCCIWNHTYWGKMPNSITYMLWSLIDWLNFDYHDWEYYLDHLQRQQQPFQIRWKALQTYGLMFYASNFFLQQQFGAVAEGVSPFSEPASEDVRNNRFFKCGRGLLWCLFHENLDGRSMLVKRPTRQILWLMHQAIRFYLHFFPSSLLINEVPVGEDRYSHWYCLRFSSQFAYHLLFGWQPKNLSIDDPTVVKILIQNIDWKRNLHRHWGSVQGQRDLHKALVQNRRLRLAVIRSEDAIILFLKRKDRKTLIGVFFCLEPFIIVIEGHLQHWLDILSQRGIVKGKKERIQTEIQFILSTCEFRSNVHQQLLLNK